MNSPSVSLIQNLVDAILRDVGPSTPHQLSLQVSRGEDLAREVKVLLESPEAGFHIYTHNESRDK